MGLHGVDYVLADSETGEIIQSGFCPEANVPANAILGYGKGNTHYVLDGQIVAYTPEQVATKAQRPDYACAWSNTLFQWVDVRTLAMKKLAKWEEIKWIRSQKDIAPFTWDGSTFDADTESRSRLLSAANVALLARFENVSYSTDWILADNTVRTLTAADMAALIRAYEQYVRGLFATSRQLRQAILAATTDAELAAVVWPP